MNLVFDQYIIIILVQILPKYNQSVLDAMEEARRISKDPNVKGYNTMEELKAALESD